MSDIGCDVIAANAKHRGMPYITIDVNSQIGCTAAHVAHDYTHLTFRLGEHNFS